MITAHYRHRLPADYDLDRIRHRAKARGPAWDATADLYFKGFLLREAGKQGAIENSYSSLYLWRSDQGFVDFLLSDRYRHLTERFGRAQIDVRVVLDARKGRATQARYVFEQSRDIGRDVELGDAISQEVAHNRDTADQPGIVAAITAVDTRRWRVSRFLLTEDPALMRDAAAQTYEVLHLASPLLNTLQGGAAS